MDEQTDTDRLGEEGEKTGSALGRRDKDRKMQTEIKSLATVRVL